MDEDQRFDVLLTEHGVAPLVRTEPTTMQLNLGKRCNQACRHCHVDAGPTRTEMMDSRTVNRVLELLQNSPSIDTVDITGGAPELHPAFENIVRSARMHGRHVMDRCNLTVLLEDGQEHTVDFLADHHVEVVASLPCYGPENVDHQRGSGVFNSSISGLRQLNARGYGLPDSGLILNLVYNPVGPFLPPDQYELEEAYKDRLNADFGIQFNQLFTITNMPIARFQRDLAKNGMLEGYLRLLNDSFNPVAVGQLMCKSLVSIGWEGQLYDCDFNQMLQLPIGAEEKTIWDIESLTDLSNHVITTGRHCMGCTAGAGSSCGGALQ
jgi:radical SAM/Cys-rich protein